MTTATEIRAPVGPPIEAAAPAVDPWTPPMVAPSARPVVIGVDDSPAAAAAVRDGVRLAGDLAAPIVFVYVRRGPSDALGEPYYQRRLDAEMRIGHRAIAAGIAAARRAGQRRAAAWDPRAATRGVRPAERRAVHRRRGAAPPACQERVARPHPPRRPSGAGGSAYESSGGLTPRRRRDVSIRLRHGCRMGAESVLVPMVHGDGRRHHRWAYIYEGVVMPYGVFPVPRVAIRARAAPPVRASRFGSGPASDVPSRTRRSRPARTQAATPSSPFGRSS